MVVCDRGSEFLNKEFKTYCETNGIKVILPQASTHAAYIERFNRTLKSLIYKYMTENETYRFVDQLPNLVHSYNNRYHSAIKMTPAEAERNTDSTALFINNELSKRELRLLPGKSSSKPALAKGQYVRRALQKGKFSRGFNQQTQQEVYQIDDVDVRKPLPLYKLSKIMDGSTVDVKPNDITQQRKKTLGKFYRNEITPISTELKEIEAILDEQLYKNIVYVFVKWRGYSNKFNSWIMKNKIVETYST
jgi:hypothetical protein